MLDACIEVPSFIPCFAAKSARQRSVTCSELAGLESKGAKPSEILCTFRSRQNLVSVFSGIFFVRLIAFVLVPIRRKPNSQMGHRTTLLFSSQASVRVLRMPGQRSGEESVIQEIFHGKSANAPFDTIEAYRFFCDKNIITCHGFRSVLGWDDFELVPIWST